MKTLWEKEKLLVPSNFSFSHNVFHNYISILHQNAALCGNGILTHYQTTNFRLVQTERVCRRQFQIWRKWKKVIQTGKNTVGKGEIACYEQFLLFLPCFQKACFPGASKGVIVWEWVKTWTLYHTILTFNDPKEVRFGKKHCGRRIKCL